MKVLINGNLTSDPKVVSDKLTTITIAEKAGEEDINFVEILLSGDIAKRVVNQGIGKGDLVNAEGLAHVEKVKEGEKYFNDVTIWGTKVDLRYKAGSKKRASETPAAE